MNIFGVEIRPEHVMIGAAAILLLWIARRYVRRVLWGFFFGLAAALGAGSRILMRSAEILYDRYADGVAAHRVEVLERRLITLEGKLEKRIPRLETGIDKASADIERSTQTLLASTEELQRAAPTQTALEAFRAALTDGADRPKNAQVGGAVKAFRDTFRTSVAAIRDDVRRVRQDAPRLIDGAQRLRTIQGGLTRAADTANAAFKAFEEGLESENRRAVAAKQSIVFPWLAAILILVIALSGVFLNFFLIQRPMAEIVGEGFEVFGVGLPVAAAIVVILLEFVAGVVLFEAAGVTRLLPAFESVGVLTRRILFAVAIVFLIGFSVFEAAIAIQRDALIQMDERILAIAAGEASPVAEGGFAWGTLAQVLLAILIPWLLAVAAIPLETVLHTGWFIILLVTHQILAFAGLLLKMLSTALRSLGAFVLEVYDLIIFLPLTIERLVRDRRKKAEARTRAAAPPLDPQGQVVDLPLSRRAPQARDS